MTAKKPAEKNIELFKKIKPIATLQNKLEHYQDLQKELLNIENKMKEWLKKGELTFNISSQNDIDLVYFIFRNAEQYTFGDERYHYYHINITKRGIKRLDKMIDKTNKKIETINKKIENLGWLNENEDL